jgi:hypothetical protein
MLDQREQEVLDFINAHPSMSSGEISEQSGIDVSYATLKRILKQLISEKLIVTTGRGRGTRYEISLTYDLFYPVDPIEYFSKEIDAREIRDKFNLSLISDVLNKASLFTPDETTGLKNLQRQYEQNIKGLDKEEYQTELERLAIDLSWKSSQIEGNTYSLLETERLLKEKQTAEGRTKDEAVMLLNHKEAIDFIVVNPSYLIPVTVSAIEDIHTLLTKELGIARNIRHRRIGITGTNYTPLDNEFQIREVLQHTCDLFNSKSDVFEKALLLLALISYIQPFGDGNKRTARIVSNAALIAHGHCPISFRTVDPIEYKKAMLLFYEQNNLTVFKALFISQFEFAVKTYF